MKLKYVFITMMSCCLMFSAKAQTQFSPQLLIGEWRLDSIGYKQISPSERQKRYIYTADTLVFKSPKINTAGPYVILADSSSHEWYIPEVPKPMLTNFKFIDNDTLIISDGTNQNEYGFLVRISEKGIAHYKQGLEAEKDKNFHIAFREFSAAAALYHPDAMYKLGMHYFTGTATKLDEIEGSKWIREAAKLGNAAAQAIVNSNSLQH